MIADSWEDAFKLIETAPQQFAPGASWSYNQTNYVLLARIIERLSGMTAEAFLAERLFRPLGMRSAFFPFPGDSARPCAVNYEPGVATTPTVRSLEFPPFIHMAGGLCASLGDLIRWNMALDSSKVVGPALTKEMWSSTVLNDGSTYRVDGKSIGYGLGWIVDDAPGRRSVGSSGGNSTAYRRFIDEGFTIVMLHNGVADPDGLIASVAAIVRDPSNTSATSAQTALWDAAMVGDTAAIARSLAAGAAIDSLDTRTKPTGRRALNWSAWFNHADAVRFLLARGASIDAANASGFTALHHAAEAGAEQAAEVLLAAGANSNQPNQAGELPAATARRLGHSAIASRIDGHRP
jgi:CubicO group peptidase (beta-lactamase class C family)